jgi:CheY-like chemotaxis protein
MNNRRPSILIVDDSRVVRLTIARALAPYFNTVEAENGVAAWRTVNQNSRIELIISDIQMPEMDGYTFICKVRAAEDPALRDMPVIVITSAEDEITRERAYACGATDFVVKPFNTAQLLNCINSQLAHDYESLKKHHAQAASPSAATEAEVVPPNANGGSPAKILTLVLRLMPLLKSCNIKFKLGMDRELAVFQQRVAAAHEALKKDPG